ncbi:MAG: molecular chaperone DnaJ [Bacilli bacterium]
MAEKRDFYEVLGVSKSATKDEIKSAYRKLAKVYHPDNKQTGDEAKFKEIQEAYDVLYDDQKRQTYDQFGHAAFDQSAGGGAGGFNGFQGGFGDVDLGDLFGSFFGGGRSRSRGNSNGPRRGNDTLQRVEISFMDSINGKKVKLTVNYDQTCTRCNGTGAKDSSSIKTCSKCNGRGSVVRQQQTIFGVMQSETTCPDCGGTGKVVSEKCSECLGKGYKRVKSELDVNIPAGITSGQQIRIAGKGERGSNGGPNGDLYLEVIVKQHEYFTRQGNDIHINVPIDLVMACLGTKITVPTVYGDIEVNVPEGTQPNSILKVKGKGVKELNGSNYGDQYIHLQVKTPTKLSSEQRKLLTKFSEITPKSESVFEKFKNKFKR